MVDFNSIPSEAVVEIAKSFQNDKDWQNQKWTSIISNIKKIITEFDLGKDYIDDEFAATILAKEAIKLIYFSKKFPINDDRLLLKNNLRIGLDLDGVIFDFNKAYSEKFNTKMSPYWTANYQIGEHLKQLESDKEFWINLPVLHRPKCEIVAYITSRSIPIEWCQLSLEKNGLPCAPIFMVPWNESKIDILKSLNLDIFIDDKLDNYLEATNNGIFTYLMDAEHNRYYNVGHRRIYDLDILI